jgi:hypothetical protein
MFSPPRVPRMVELHGQNICFTVWWSVVVGMHGATMHSTIHFTTHHIVMSCFFACKLLLDAVTKTRGWKDSILGNVVSCSPYLTSERICTDSHSGSKSALYYYKHRMQWNASQKHAILIDHNPLLEKVYSMSQTCNTNWSKSIISKITCNASQKHAIMIRNNSIIISMFQSSN